jgi:hypothetical protein
MIVVQCEDNIAKIIHAWRAPAVVCGLNCWQKQAQQNQTQGNHNAALKCLFPECRRSSHWGISLRGSNVIAAMSEHVDFAPTSRETRKRVRPQYARSTIPRLVEIQQIDIVHRFPRTFRRRHLLSHNAHFE